MDRLGFWGIGCHDKLVAHGGFQYPLMDRLGFWGVEGPEVVDYIRDFSIR